MRVLVADDLTVMHAYPEGTTCGCGGRRSRWRVARRQESKKATELVLDWKPDVVIILHTYGVLSLVVIPLFGHLELSFITSVLLTHCFCGRLLVGTLASRA